MALRVVSTRQRHCRKSYAVWTWFPHTWSPILQRQTAYASANRRVKPSSTQYTQLWAIRENYNKRKKKDERQKRRHALTRTRCGRTSLTLIPKREIRKRYPAGWTTRPDAKSLLVTSVAPIVRTLKREINGSRSTRQRAMRLPHIDRFASPMVSLICSAPQHRSQQCFPISWVLSTLGTFPARIPRSSARALFVTRATARVPAGVPVGDTQALPPLRRGCRILPVLAGPFLAHRWLIARCRH